MSIVKILNFFLKKKVAKKVYCNYCKYIRRQKCSKNVPYHNTPYQKIYHYVDCNKKNKNNDCCDYVFQNYLDW